MELSFCGFFKVYISIIFQTYLNKYCEGSTDVDTFIDLKKTIIELNIYYLCPEILFLLLLSCFYILLSLSSIYIIDFFSTHVYACLSFFLLV